MMMRWGAVDLRDAHGMCIYWPSSQPHGAPATLLGVGGCHITRRVCIDGTCACVYVCVRVCVCICVCVCVCVSVCVGVSANVYVIPCTIYCRISNHVLPVHKAQGLIRKLPGCLVPCVCVCVCLPEFNLRHWMFVFSPAAVLLANTRVWADAVRYFEDGLAHLIIA